MLRIAMSISALVMASGFLLPHLAGTAVPAAVYNILQIGGIVATLVFALLYSRELKALKASTPPDEG